MSFEANEALSRRLYEEVFGRGNLNAADEILSQDHVSHGPGAPPIVGTEAIKKQAILLRTAIPDLQVTLHDQIADDNRVVSRWTATGTHTGQLTMPSGAMPATGARISFDEIRIDRFSHGKIVESWFIPDRFALWQQLGLIPAFPSSSTSQSKA
jgi:predicted ester cyclase